MLQETKFSFAGFEWPRSLYQLPKAKHGESLKDRLTKRKKDNAFTSCYYLVPTPDKKTQTFYLESDFMPSLRWEWADQVDGVRIDHKGWYSNNYGDGDTIRGIVFRLPSNRGFLAGWSMGEGMASSIDYAIWENEVDAARDADSMAERTAEDEREYQAKEDAKIRIEDIMEEIKTLYSDFRDTTRELRANCDRIAGIKAVHDLVRAEWKRVKGKIRDLRREREKIERDGLDYGY